MLDSLSFTWPIIDSDIAILSRIQGELVSGFKTSTQENIWNSLIMQMYYITFMERANYATSPLFRLSHTDLHLNGGERIP